MKLFISILLLASVYASTALARDFIIAGTPQQLYKYSSKGDHRGIDIDTINLVMEELEIDYKIILIDSDARIQKMALAGQVDMLLSYSKTSDRLKYLSYSEESYKSVEWNLFIRAEDKNIITFESWSDLEKMNLAVVRGASYTPKLWSSNLNYDVVSSHKFLIPMLLRNRIDAVPLNAANTIYEARKNGYIEKIHKLPKLIKADNYFNPITIASQHPQKSKVLEGYDRIIKHLEKDGKIKAIFQKYLDIEPVTNEKHSKSLFSLYR